MKKAFLTMLIIAAIHYGPNAKPITQATSKNPEAAVALNSKTKSAVQGKRAVTATPVVFGNWSGKTITGSIYNSSGASYDFTAPPGVSYLPFISDGTYDIVFYPPFNDNSMHYYYASCGGSSSASGVGQVNIYGAYIDDFCNQIDMF
jgi:hypothetical protein